MPKVKHIDKSVTRRFYFLELRNSFVGREDIHLKEKLSKERKQILVWAFK
jgi:phage/plasmid-associated DNA primase